MLMFLVLVLVSQHASGVEVYEGAESVLLPCKLPVKVTSNSTAVWDREDLKDPTVHVHVQRVDKFEYQNKRYTNRTSMFTDALQTGDVSLTLRKPTVSDSGTYTCTIRRGGEDLNKTEVQLNVTEPPGHWPKILTPVLGTLVLLAFVCGLFGYCAHKRKKKSKVLQPEVVEVSQGKESVLLPFKITADLPQEVRVEWTHNYMKVHVYESGNNQPDNQDQVYRGRTEMNDDPLKTKDFSLTLKDLHLTNSGVYTCTIYNSEDNGEDMLLQKVVILSVRALQPEVVEVTQGVKSVLLPFKTTPNLPEYITVEWRLTAYKHMKVHAYESGRDQPDNLDQHQVYRGRTEMKEDALRTGDFSLTLKEPRLTDSGVYTCTVYDKDGLMLLQKSVTLSVREYQVEMVEVTQGKESVLLPFKATADLPQDVRVEWTDSNVMMVHVYESGNNQPDKQDQEYRGRTEMNEDPLRTGDLSLTLKEPLLTDSGVYNCTVNNKDGLMLTQKSVTLSVRVPQPEIVEVAKSAQLPFQTTSELPQDIKVEWTLTGPQYKAVHVYENGNSQPDEQHQDFRGRTEMKEDALITGDFSLTLKDLCLTDSGVYNCTVYNKDGDKLTQKSVTLSVRDVGMEMVSTQGLKFVMLPFKIPRDLPQGTTVEWRHNNVKVYKYTDVNVDSQHVDDRGRTEMKEDALRTGDLSLTLKDLHLTDSGVYTCTVYNKDGHMLLQKSVTLRVRESQPEVVEVKQGLRSVQLPFETTSVLSQDVTVEWRLTEPKYMVVHMYTCGNDQPDKHNQVYRGRTEMNEEPLENGDLSLTLKEPRLTDSGFYTCTVYNKDGDMLTQKSVTLRVTATLVGAMADMLPRLRRRRAPEEPGNRNQEQQRLIAETRV